MIALIVAISKNYVIGKDNQLIWNLSADLKHFRKTTKGHVVVMGRKTYESIGRPLPKRVNIVVTRDKDYKAEGCEIVHSLREAVETPDRASLQDNNKKIFIIGGGNIYKQSMEMVDTLYITHVHTEIDGDAFFPEIDMNVWKEVEREDYKADEENEYDYSFVVYKRK